MQSAQGLPEAIRPEPGLARGLWAAPPWVFVAALCAVAVAVLVWATRAGGAWARRRPGARR